MKSRFVRLPVLLAAGLMAAATMPSAWAQTQATAPDIAAPKKAATAAQSVPAGAAAPGNGVDAKMIGDWNVRCFPVQSAAPCDVFQMLVNKKLKQRVMSVSIAYAPAASRYLIQIIVPLEVALQQGVMLQAGSYKSPKMIYRRCSDDGCVIEGPVDSSIITGLAQAGGGTAKAVIGTPDGKSIDLPISLKGFADALSAMKSQAAEKAKK